MISGIGELKMRVNGQSSTPFEINSQVKNRRKQETKASDGKIDPLDVVQRLFTFTDTDENRIGAQHRRNDGPDSIKGL